jgi:iron complex transport system substrate-binding protein
VKKILLIALLGLVVLAGCNPRTNSNISNTNVLKPKAFVDASGDSIQLDKYPERIVIEGKLTQMILDFYLLFPGQSQKLAGIQKRLQTVLDFVKIVDPSVESKLNLEQDASAEQVAPLNPDLVIMKSSLKNTLGSPFKTIDVPVVYMDFENPMQIEREITNLGLILDQNERAAEINQLFKTWQELVTKKTSDLEDSKKPHVLLLQYSERNGVVAFDVPPASWLQTEMVEMAGGFAVWKDFAKSGGWMTVSLEQIAAWDADQIFIINYSGNSAQIVGQLLTDGSWKEKRAVKNSSVFGFPGDFLSWDQPDPRWVLGLNWLGNKLHPELVNFEKDTIIERFFKEFYSLDINIIGGKIMTTLKGSLN